MSEKVVGAGRSLSPPGEVCSTQGQPSPPISLLHFPSVPMGAGNNLHHPSPQDTTQVQGRLPWYMDQLASPACSLHPRSTAQPSRRAGAPMSPASPQVQMGVSPGPVPWTTSPHPRVPTVSPPPQALGARAAASGGPERRETAGRRGGGRGRAGRKIEPLQIAKPKMPREILHCHSCLPEKSLLIWG